MADKEEADVAQAVIVLGKVGLKRLTRNYTVFAGILGGFVWLWGWAGWGFPLVKASDYAHDKVEMETKISANAGAVDDIKHSVNEIRAGQLEQSRLQALSRVQDLAAQLATRPQGDPFRAMLQSYQNEAQTTSDRLDAELKKLRRGP